MIENAGGMGNDPMSMGMPGGFPSLPGMGPATGPAVNPFANMNAPKRETTSPVKESSGLNVDELVKKIDAKIAELEKEEEEERKKIEEQKKKKKETKDSKTEEVKEESEKKDEVSNIAPTIMTGYKDKKEETSALQGTQNENSEVSNYRVTDDQFFDDFFDE